MRAAKIRRERAPLYRIALFPQRRTRASAQCLRKYPKSGLLGSLRSKIPVGSGGTTAFFGKRIGPGLGSWATGFNFVSSFLGYDIAGLSYQFSFFLLPIA
ncbi:MAG: hypothetical protein ABSF48_13535 [Thermodesulfobacteriota bacterium]|jgi:hypothetical protein